ncbi:AraC family transcriptional regulator ligand-binding domain-containing protein [Dokdonella sp.]|uniref:AraC family transcriptional regulator n=1 Tax=Dokdonella sp. TaxID=2291710 RepID=UPI0035273010
MPSSARTRAFLPARYYALLVHMIHGPDLPASELLEPIGLDLETLDDAETMLSPDQVDALLKRAERMSGRDDLGMQLGRLIKPSSHEYLGYALMTSATLGDALQIAARYWRLITPAFRLSLAREQHGIRIILEPVVAMSLSCLRFHVDTIATAFHEELRFLLSGHVPAYEVHLPSELTMGPGIRRWLAPARVHFDAPGMTLQMLISEQVTARPLALADRSALRIARQRCDEAMARMTVRGSLGDWVRLMLEKASGHQPRQQELATMLHVSTRTMNRRLDAEGTSFRQLGTIVRQARARRMLIESDLSITRIALQLGYADTANFTRAFRIENGTTPARFRSLNRSLQ